MQPVDCIFADPPDNIGLNYGEVGYQDNLEEWHYKRLLHDWLLMFLRKAPVVWLSFNSRHIHTLGHVVHELHMGGYLNEWDFKPCVQTFTFGQYNDKDLSNCHRPLWRFMSPAAKLYPDAIRVESERMKAGDKRAKGPRVPGDVFDYPRVVGNSRQRRKWHPTQLNEDLVERCILLTTKEGGHVLDPFGGTGTTARVCQRLNRNCTLIEISPTYCHHIAKDLFS